MGDGYQVNIEELGTLINSLDHAAQNMTDATAKLRNASAQGLGSHAIDGAGRDFQGRWGYGIGKIADAAGKMTESLRAAQKDYQQTEDAVASMYPTPDAPAPQGPTGRNGDTTASNRAATTHSAVPAAGSTDAAPARSRISQALDGPPAAGAAHPGGGAQ